MAQLLKNIYTPDYLHSLSTTTRRYAPTFDHEQFIAATIAHSDWDELALRARQDCIAQQLYHCLNTDYATAIEQLMQVSNHFGGGEAGDLAALFFADIVALFGLEEFELSMQALAHFTTRASAEFAIRAFILRHPAATMAQLERWATDTNMHRRRLASEGCRPRLPWGKALPDFKRDPSPILPILDALKDDPESYVRRSVANNLNDISKDHPAQVIQLSRQWFGENANRNRLLKHANRSLLKQSDPETLQLFGYAELNQHTQCTVQHDLSVNWAQTLTFQVDLVSPTILGKLRIEFVIGFMKHNGTVQTKVFQLADHTVAATTRRYHKQFSFHAISTRRYYPGRHTLAIKVNGITQYRGDFELTPARSAITTSQGA